MLQDLYSDDINYQTDPPAIKQYKTEPPKDQQIHQFNKAVNSLKVDLLATLHDSTAIGKRIGLDFLLLANKHSRRF